jgi:hypothetical protein
MDTKRSILPSCKFPAFNSEKMIERQVERSLHEQYFFDEIQRPKGGAEE